MSEVSNTDAESGQVAPAEHSPEPPSLAAATRTWWHIGLLSFGGPAAQIALMHREIVERKRWLSEQQFLNALSFCMLLPGPEAMQLATYSGWRLHGVRGGLVAGWLFELPGAVVILLLALLYGLYGEVPLVDALFLGIKAAVIVIVIEALLRVARKALKSPVHWLIATVAFVGIFFFHLSFPLIVLLAALVGFALLPAAVKTDRVAAPQPVSLGATVKTVLLWLAIWLTPLIVLLLCCRESLLFDVGVFFSHLAVVTFGGAYAVLAWLAQDVVTQYQWLTASEMMDGLGLAETTPGPLILVTEFVGYLAGYRESGIVGGVLAALLTLWVTFAPCFLWIFAGAPHIDWICRQPRLQGALSAITAAVVGVMLNLSLWFALHVLFTQVHRTASGPLQWWRPELSSFDWRVLLLTAAAAMLLLYWRRSVLLTLMCVAILGGLLSAVTT